jgi:hypothetical protein
VFDAERATFLESGCALIVGSASPDGEPNVGRAWGITILPEPGQVRVLLDVEDDATVRNATAGGGVAVTGASIMTLRSVQLKGRALGVEDATAADVGRAERYCEAFYGDLYETDRVERSLFDRLVPSGYVACTLAVEHVFDQTPGPGAGAPIDAGAR